MTSVPVDIHKSQAAKMPAVPEPWSWRDTLSFTVVGLVMFSALFAFMFSLGDM